MITSDIGRCPLSGHPYHQKTNAELRGIVADASETARFQHGMPSEGKYLDQVNDACTVLYHRRINGLGDVVLTTYLASTEESR